MTIVLALVACGLPDDADTLRPPDGDTGAPDTGAETGTETDTDTGDPAVDTGAWPATGLPACDDANRDTGGTMPDCVETFVWSPPCDRDPGVLTRTGLLWSGVTAELDELGAAATVTLTDAPSWDALVAAWTSVDPPAISVDFSTHVVVIVQDHVSSSCGVSIPSHGVYLPEGAPARVYARFEDSSGACGWSCDLVQQAIVVYAVPRADGYPGVCSEEINRCQM
ncbi:MAG: hypothetical protein Q8P41_28350 [Pseudomonadota bacterium]|nr:hypothetical protein [Pseudomonadota bacterium]